MIIENGWCFYSADFSMQAAGLSETGIVTLTRNVEDTGKWHDITDGLDINDYPPLYLGGEGKTIEEAIIDANLIAAHVEPLNT